MALEGGIRRLVFMLFGCGAVGLWQAGIALHEARLYQVQMREAAALWGSFDDIYTRGRLLENDSRAKLTRAQVDRAKSSDSISGIIVSGDKDAVQGLFDSWHEEIRRAADRIWRQLWEEEQAQDPVLQGVKFEKFDDYKLWRSGSKLLPLEEQERKWPTFIAGIRDDVQAVAGHATDAEIWTARYWVVRAGGPSWRDGGPWQFTWWPSQPGWWRWRLPLIAILGLLLSGGFSAIPWSLYYLARWIIQGFFRSDTIATKHAPMPGHEVAAPRWARRVVVLGGFLALFACVLVWSEPRLVATPPLAPTPTAS
jgi:hypothetical protein